MNEHQGSLVELYSTYNAEVDSQTGDDSELIYSSDSEFSEMSDVNQILQNHLATSSPAFAESHDIIDSLLKQPQQSPTIVPPRTKQPQRSPPIVPSRTILPPEESSSESEDGLDEEAGSPVRASVKFPRDQAKNTEGLKMAKRDVDGVKPCPFCNKTFKDLKVHIENVHPDPESLKRISRLTRSAEKKTAKVSKKKVKDEPVEDVSDWGAEQSSSSESESEEDDTTSSEEEEERNQDLRRSTRKKSEPRKKPQPSQKQQRRRSVQKKLLCAYDDCDNERNPDFASGQYCGPDCRRFVADSNFRQCDNSECDELIWNQVSSYGRTRVRTCGDKCAIRVRFKKSGVSKKDVLFPDESSSDEEMPPVKTSVKKPLSRPQEKVHAKEKQEVVVGVKRKTVVAESATVNQESNKRRKVQEKQDVKSTTAVDIKKNGSLITPVENHYSSAPVPADKSAIEKPAMETRTVDKSEPEPKSTVDKSMSEKPKTKTSNSKSTPVLHGVPTSNGGVISGKTSPVAKEGSKGTKSDDLDSLIAKQKKLTLKWMKAGLLHANMDDQLAFQYDQKLLIWGRISEDGSFTFDNDDQYAQQMSPEEWQSYLIRRHDLRTKKSRACFFHPDSCEDFETLHQQYLKTKTARRAKKK